MALVFNAVVGSDEVGFENAFFGLVFFSGDCDFEDAALNAFISLEHLLNELIDGQVGGQPLLSPDRPWQNDDQK